MGDDPVGGEEGGEELLDQSLWLDWLELDGGGGLVVDAEKDIVVLPLVYGDTGLG